MDIYNTISSSIYTALTGGTGNLVKPLEHNQLLTNTVSYIDNRFLYYGSQAIIATGEDTKITILISPALSSEYSPHHENTVLLGSLYTPGGTLASKYCRNSFMIRNYGAASFDLLLRAINYTGNVAYTFEFMIFSKNERSYTLPNLTI